MIPRYCTARRPLPPLNPGPAQQPAGTPRPFTSAELALPLLILVSILVPTALLWHTSFFWPLAAGWLVAALVALRAGYPLGPLLLASWRSMRDTLGIVVIIALIGALTAVWFQSGTIPALVLHSLNVAAPRYLPLWGFIATAVTSLLIGSAIGTMGTVGVTLMGVGQALGVPAPLLAGALVSGAFVGDRTSLVSSIFQMLAQVNRLKPDQLLPGLLKTGVPAVLLCLVAYAAAGWYAGAAVAVPPSDSEAGVYAAAEHSEAPGATSQTVRAIKEHFRIDGWTLLPALAVIGLAALRVPIRRCLLASIVAAALVALFRQGAGAGELLRAMALGYPGVSGSPELAGLKGGGIWATREVLTLLVIAGALNGVLTHCGMLQQLLQQTLKRITGNFALVCFTGALSTLLGAITCTQTLTILLPSALLRPLYHERGLADSLLARTLADTGVVIVGLIPWSLMSLIFATVLGIPTQSYAPYAFFLWLLPLITLAVSSSESKRSARTPIGGETPHIGA